MTAGGGGILQCCGSKQPRIRNILPDPEVLISIRIWTGEEKLTLNKKVNVEQKIDVFGIFFDVKTVSRTVIKAVIDIEVVKSIIDIGMYTVQSYQKRSLLPPSQMSQTPRKPLCVITGYRI